MKTRGLSSVFALVAIGTALHSAPAVAMAEEPVTLKILIDIPSYVYGWKGAPTEEPTLRQRYPQDDHFNVIIENLSSEPVYLAESNHWIDGLYFEMVVDDGQKTVSKRRLIPASANVSGELVIAPGQAGVEEIYYGRDWEPFPFPGQTVRTRKVAIQAILYVPPPSEKSPHRMKAHWVGRTVSEPRNVIFDSL